MGLRCPSCIVEGVEGFSSIVYSSRSQLFQRHVFQESMHFILMPSALLQMYLHRLSRNSMTDFDFIHPFRGQECWCSWEHFAEPVCVFGPSAPHFLYFDQITGSFSM